MEGPARNAVFTALFMGISRRGAPPASCAPLRRAPSETLRGLLTLSGPALFTHARPLFKIENCTIRHVGHDTTLSSKFLLNVFD